MRATAADFIGSHQRDEPLVRLREAALELLAEERAGTVFSLLYAQCIIDWLGTEPVVTGDVLAHMTQLQHGLLQLPAPPPLDFEQVATMWAVATSNCQVPKQAEQEDCEYLAHAVCLVLNAAFPDAARHQLVKVWSVPRPGLRLHAEYQWNHHVAPALYLADGNVFVFDLLLAPDAPLLLSNWQAAVGGNLPGTDVFTCSQPWEAFGALQFEVLEYAPEAMILVAHDRPKLTACLRTDGGQDPLPHPQ